MTRDIHDALTSHSVEYAVRRELHDVRPHRVYEVEFGGTRAVCKLGRSPEADPAREARVLQYVDENASIPVPTVLTVGPDHFVAEWHDGVPDDPTLTDARAAAMGRGLATLHAEAAPEFDRSGRLSASDGRLRVDGDDRWSDTLCALLADRREFLADVGYEDVAAAALAVVRERRDLFDAAPYVTLLHGNFLPDHVGLEDGDVACVIDFEHALVGPAEFDYQRAALPMFHGPDAAAESARERFREGYESVRPLPPGFEQRWPAHELVNLVSYLKALHLQRGDRDTAQSVARRAHGTREYAYDLLERLRGPRE